MAKLFFSTDGSWGDAEGISIIDTAGLNEHFTDYIEFVREYSLSAWADWFSKNDHEAPDTADGECVYCENYEVGSLVDIDRWLSEE